MVRPLTRASQSAAVWPEVLARRGEWHRQDVAGSMETWEAADRTWCDRIEDVVREVADSLVGASEVDPRAAAIDGLAVLSALVDAIDGTDRRP